MPSSENIRYWQERGRLDETGRRVLSFVHPDFLEMRSREQHQEAERQRWEQAAPPGAAGARLVKGSKSPTGLAEHPEGAAQAPDHGRWVAIEHRRWSDEYRVRLQVETAAEQRPPEQSGDRITRTLSSRGRTKLAECAAYVASHHGGFNTFLTLTLDAEARARIEERDDAGRYVSSVQREVSRFMDAAQKMRRRGWVPAYVRSRKRGAGFRLADGSETAGPWVALRWNRKRRKVAGEGGAWLACWVAENPINEQGQRNPHVHLLMRWGVPYCLFQAWARRLEQIWGQGFAHLERLRAGEAAGYYLLKAIGYLTKGAGAAEAPAPVDPQRAPDFVGPVDPGRRIELAAEQMESAQGPIRGNRYGISAAARAPGWVMVTPEWRLAWDNMGELMQQLQRAYARRVMPLREQRDNAKSCLARAPKKRRTIRRRAKTMLEQAQAKLRGMGWRAGRWEIVVQGSERLDSLLEWAKRKGWNMDPKAHSRRLARQLRQYQEAAERRRQWAALLEAERLDYYDEWSQQDVTGADPGGLLLA